MAGFTDAYNSVASVLGGAQTAFNWFICALIILTIISAGGVWQQGGVRIQAMAGLDGAAPLWFGKFSKAGHAAHHEHPLGDHRLHLRGARLPHRRGQPRDLLRHHGLGDHLAHGDDVHLPDPGRDHAAQEVPGPSPAVPRARRPVFLWLCVIGAEAIVIITIITLLWPGLLDNALGQPYDIIYWWGVSRAYFETVTLGIVGFFLLMAVVFWAIGKRNIKKGLVGENDLLAIDPEALAAGGSRGRRPPPPRSRGGLSVTASRARAERRGRRRPGRSASLWRRCGPTSPCRFHDEAGLEPLHDATLRLLETTGMRFESPKALAILKKAGAKVDEGSDLVRLPRRLVEEALAPAPRQFTLGARDAVLRPAASAPASPTAPPTAAASRSSTGTPASAARPPRPTSRPSRACRTASARSATGGRR